MALSIAAAGAGWWSAKRAYDKPGKSVPEPIAEAAPPVYTVLLNKCYVDELYDKVFTGRSTVGGSVLAPYRRGRRTLEVRRRGDRWRRERRRLVHEVHGYRLLLVG